MTNLLYSLMIFNERLEGFFIGLFESSEKARQAAEHYLSALPGFKQSDKKGVAAVKSINPVICLLITGSKIFRIVDMKCRIIR